MLLNRTRGKAVIAACVLVGASACGGTSGNIGGGTSTQEIERTATLSGAHEVPPVATRGRGDVRASLDGRRLVVEGSFEGLGSDLIDVQGSSAHVHEGARNENGPIVVSLSVSPGQDNRSGSFSFDGEISDEQAQAFQEGRLYVNVHTADNPDGELRGQLALDQPEALAFDVTLSGDAEVPPVDTSASGSANVSLVGDVMLLVGDFSGLSSDLLEVDGSPAHVHLAPSGEAGPVVFPVEVAPGEDNRSGSFRLAQALTPEQQAQFLAGRYYVNVHSADNPDGELRAQLDAPDVEAELSASLSGQNEVPPVDTPATGEANASVDGRGFTIEGSFEGLQSDLLEVSGSPAHIHLAAVGENGAIAFPLEVTAGDDNRSGTFRLQTDLTDEQAESLFAGQWYVNVHTVDQPEGEIRGQLFFQPRELPVVVALTGGAEVPQVTTDATGQTRATLTGNRLEVAGTFRGLSSDLIEVEGSPAHVHRAAAGETGPIVFNLDVTPGDDNRSGTFTGSADLTDAQVIDFRDGLHYVNVHTEQNPDGELRAQLEPPAPQSPVALQITRPRIER